MRKVLALLVVVFVVTMVVVAFAQQGQGRGGQGQGRQPRGRGMQPTSSGMSSVIAGGKIYILKDDVIYKVNAADLKVEKKNKLELAQDQGQLGRWSRMLGGRTLKAEGKSLFILDRTAIYKISMDSLELEGTLKDSDLTPPEEEKEEGKEEGKEGGDGGGGDF